MVFSLSLGNVPIERQVQSGDAANRYRPCSRRDMMVRDALASLRLVPSCAKSSNVSDKLQAGEHSTRRDDTG